MWPFGKSAKARLEDALKEQKLTAPLGLKVEVRNKTAFISGEVPSERYKNLVTAIAQGINGVEGVDLTGVTVKENPAAEPVPAEDPSAKAKAAHAKIQAESSLANNPLDVLQKGSTIVLRGAVDSQEEFDKAKRLAESVEGVTGVDVSGLQVIAHASDLNQTDDEGDVVYTVKSGDTLSHIALHYYGSAGRSSYMKIAEANGISDPNKIRVGQQLKIPGTTQGPEARLG
jgi:nucleoid-associated protein YgaU